MVSPSRGLLFSSLGAPCPPGPPPSSSPDYLPSQPSVPTPCPRRPHHRLPRGPCRPLPLSLVTKEPTRDWCPHHSECLPHALPAARSTRGWVPLQDPLQTCALPASTALGCLHGGVWALEAERVQGLQGGSPTDKGDQPTKTHSRGTRRPALNFSGSTFIQQGPPKYFPSRMVALR